MAIPTTTTSALASINGAAGDMHFNTDTKQLVLFHSAGIGSSYYSQFSNDGTVGASIELTFNNNGSDYQEVDESTSGGITFDVSAANLSGYYKRYNSVADAFTDIGNDTNMIGSNSSAVWGASVIPGSDQQGSMNYSPVMYQANEANSPNVATYNAPVVFVYTGSVKGGGVVSTAATATDGFTPRSWYCVPIIFLINEGASQTAPFWGLTMAVAEASAGSSSYTINFPYYSDAMNSGSDYGIMQWGSGLLPVGNNEATVRTNLSIDASSHYITSNVYGSQSGNQNASSWSLEHAYTP